MVTVKIFNCPRFAVLSKSQLISIGVDYFGFNWKKNIYRLAGTYLDLQNNIIIVIIVLRTPTT